MPYIKKSLLDHLFFRFLLLFLVSGVIPFLMFWEYILSGNIQLTQINSLIAINAWLFISILFLSKYDTLIYSESKEMVLPVLLLVGLCVASVFFVFRLSYSVYYLIIAVPLGVVACFYLHHDLLKHKKLVMGYVPLGRCNNITEIGRVTWMPISRHDNFKGLHALVADFDGEVLDESWQKKLAQASLEGIPVYHVLQARESLTGRIPIKYLHENNLGSLLPSQMYLLIKHLLDILLIIIISPLVLIVGIIVAIIIKWESRHTGGSVFFTQVRVGQGGHLFKLYKFRSMRPTSEMDGAKMASVGDIRVTKFGRFIRKTRIDELPQFINVLKGDMSIIGPRPEQPSFVERFNENIPFYCYRHIVRPGISGWAQVMQGYADNEDETRVKLEYDFYYIKNFSLTLDLLIAIKTIQIMLTGFGAR